MPHGCLRLPLDADPGLTAGKRPTDIDRVPDCWPDTDLVRHDTLDYAVEIEAFDTEVAALLEARERPEVADDTLVWSRAITACPSRGSRATPSISPIACCSIPAGPRQSKPSGR
ncbi:MAG: hypothetical protein FJ284_00975 [Planctomycetes bacterium]|nr:hypothetical protein [Planctomycetota bacterium]